MRQGLSERAKEAERRLAFRYHLAVIVSVSFISFWSARACGLLQRQFWLVPDKLTNRVMRQEKTFKLSLFSFAVPAVQRGEPLPSGARRETELKRNTKSCFATCGRIGWMHDGAMWIQYGGR